ncbi:MAG: Na/Pi cotransporter family protein [Paludibacteraceae bacterium]|nr:Na/Pi cotransporter family protein [Paludibacteraceae bacterium]MBP6284934.1 Na/Pi cotransporter family protein [Paludibacteraceae bacterium]
MEYTFFDLLELIGSLGLFLYGMKLMSEGLQRVAGDSLRSILAAMTKNRIMGVMTGIFVTALIQSSSATTVMVVSFVNAGLLTLFQSITVIMGANIGTTITAWILSLFGFKVSIAVFSLPLIAIAFPFVFSSNNKRKSLGEFILGFGLLFMGLDMLKGAVPDLQSNPEILSFLTQYTNYGFGSVLIFLAIGMLLTIVVQSSSATMAITLIMCSKGWLSFELGAAMVLGENIGTTITANIAAFPANVSAKRAALAHLVFNIFGVIWMLFVFYNFIDMVADIVQKYGPGDPTQLQAIAKAMDPETMSLITSADNSILTADQLALKSQFEGTQLATSYALSMFHTIFNIINTTFMLFFVGLIAKTVSWILPKKQTDEEFHLTHISTGLLSTSELSILQATKEIHVYAERTFRMFHMVKELLVEKDAHAFQATYDRIAKYENISDRMEVEIATYLTSVAEGRLSDESKTRLQAIMRMISEIESIGDSCFNMARIVKRKNEDKSEYTPEMLANIDKMLDIVEKAYNEMMQILANFDKKTFIDIGYAKEIEIEINDLRNELKLQNIIDVNEQKYTYQSSVTYMDLISECEKLGDYVVNVEEAVRDSVTA